MRIALRVLAVVTVLCVVGTAPVFAQSEDEDANIVRATVEATEWKRQDAMKRADLATLANIYAEDLSYTHSMAITQTRQQIFDMLAGGNVSYDKFTTRNTAWRVYPGAVVGAGSQTIELTVDGNPVTARNRYTVVYVKLDGRWKCVAYQSTPLPEISEQQMIR